MRRANCGVELGGSDRFCGECGAPRPVPAPSAAVPAGRGDASLWTWGVLGCGGLLLLLCVLGVGALAFSDVLGLSSLEAVATRVAGGFAEGASAGEAPADDPNATSSFGQGAVSAPSFTIHPYDPVRDEYAQHLEAYVDGYAVVQE